MSRETEHERASQSGDQRVEQVRAAFAQAWRSGQNPQVRDFLSAAGGEGDAALFQALLATEICLRRQANQSIDAELYEAEFPGRSTEIAAAFTLAEEYRHSMTADGLYAEFVRRYRAGELHDFSAWCQANPEFAERLQKLHAQNDTVHYSDSPWQTADFSLKRQRPADGEPSRYSIRERLAQGGMGVVYRVWDENLHRDLAMKLIREKVRPDDTTRNAEVDVEKLGRFIREAEITARLDHPGVIPIHDMGTDARGRIFFTMRLVQGRRLDAVFKLAQQRAEGWSQTRALDVIVKICETVAFAHSKGVIHRDLKPTNIMVGQFGETYVLDWGLAKHIGSPGDARPEPARSMASDAADKDLLDPAGADSDPTLAFETRAGDIMGTAAYMSPEQASGRIEEIDVLSDIYSTGAILYELLTGRRPYEVPGVRVDAQTIIESVIERPPVAIHKLNRLVPPELVAICEKAMARNRSQRYQSMAEMAVDLRAYLEHRVVRAYQTGAMAELRKWVRRNRGTAIASALVVLVALGGLSAVIGIQSWAYSALSVANTKVQNAFNQLSLETTLKERALRDEIRSRKIAETERRRAEGLFLARSATDVSTTNPELALLLARESAERHAGFASNSALLVALEHYRPVRELAGHRDRILTSTVSRDGTLAATASQDKTAIIWDLANGRPRCCLIGHQEWVRSAQFSSDGRLVATGSYDGTAALWNSQTGERLQVLKGSGGVVWNAAFSPDDRFVVIGDLDGNVVLWDVSSAQPVREFPGHSGEVVALQFSRTGRWLATGSTDGTVRVWSVGNGKEVARLDGHGSRIRVVQFSPGEDMLLTTVGRDPPGNVAQGAPVEAFARVWNTETWQATTLPLPGPIDAAVFNHDGSKIATATEGVIRIWGSATVTIEQSIQVTDGNIESLSFSPDGGLIAAGTTRGVISLWNTTSGRAAGRLLGHSIAVGNVQFCSPNRLFSAARDNTARVWSLDKSGFVRSLEAAEAAARGIDTKIAVSPEGRVLALTRPKAKKILLSPIPPVRDAVELNCRAAVRSVQFSPEGQWIGVLTESGEVLVFGVSDGRLQWKLDSVPATTDFTFTESGRIVVTSAENGTIRVGDVATATFQTPLVFKGMHFLLVSPDGRSLLAWPRKSPNAELWDLESSKQTALLPILDEGSSDFPSFAFSPRGDILTGRVIPFGAPRRWNARTGELLGGLGRESQSVLSLAFDPQGDSLVTLSNNGVARVWEASTGRFVSELSGHELIDSIMAIGPDASRLITHSTDHQIRLWDGRTGKSVGLLRGKDDLLSVAKFSRDGKLLLTINSDGDRVILWDAETAERLAALSNPEAEFSDAAFTPDARWFVTAGRDGSARVRSAAPDEFARGLELRTLTPHERDLFQIGTSEERDDERRQWIETALLEQLHMTCSVPVKSTEQARFAENHAFYQIEQFPEGVSAQSTREKKVNALLKLEDALRRRERLSSPVAIAFSRHYRQHDEYARAEQLLRYAINRNEPCDSSVWNSWAACCLGGLRRSPRAVLDELPGRESVAAADLVWLLERLAAGEPIRIHAGGSGLTAASGAVWRRDCFFGGGSRFNESFGGPPESTEPIRNTSDARLYQSERWFDREAPREQRSYVVPLPPGRYQVVLHFAEIFLQAPEHRVIDVVAEGATELEAYDLGTAGFATADQRRFEVEVNDGLLEIEFRGVEQNPKVSAIEISRLPD